MENIYAVVLAGGRGERFWPQSRAARPKQLLPLTGSRTMLEETLDRVEPLAPRQRQWIVTSAELVRPIGKLGLTGATIVAEPVGRNTAPAIAVAAAELQKLNPQAVMMVLPSDHHIRDTAAFRQVLKEGVRLARKGFLVTVGIAPDRPETGYGYIERGAVLGGSEAACYAVKSFREKPDAETARTFIRSGYFYWNGGIFVWRVEAILAEIARYLPDLHTRLAAWQEQGGLAAGPRAFADFYRQTEKVSIDYGVMEKSDRVAVVKGDFGWDDLGSWEALQRLLPADGHGNVVSGRAVAVDTRDTIIVADRALVATLGVKDLIIVQTRDAVLVCHRSKAQEVRRIVEQLQAGEDLQKFL